MDFIITQFQLTENWVAFSFLGFWAHHIILGMKADSHRKEIISRIIEESERVDLTEDTSENMVLLLKSDTSWLSLWLYGTAFIIAIRLVYVHFLI